MPLLVEKKCPDKALGKNQSDHPMKLQNLDKSLCVPSCPLWFVFLLGYIHDRNETTKEITGTAYTRITRNSRRCGFTGARIQVSGRRAAVHSAREGRTNMGRRWQRLPRLCRLMGTADPGARLSQRG